MNSGTTEDEARYTASRRFDNYQQYEERTRDMDIHLFMESLAKDARSAIRGLRRNPGFTLAALVTLGLGIGATTAIFSVINGVLIKPLPYPEPERLVGVWHSAVFQGATVTNFNLSPPMYVTYQEQNQTFQDFGVWSGGAANVTGLGDPEQVRSLVVTYGVLPALGVKPALGRWFSKDDDTPGTPEAVILTYGYWRRRFAGDKTVIGRTITVDSRMREIIGVMPQGFQFLRLDPDLILPQRFGGNLAPTSFNYSYFGIARLKPGVTLAQANADVGRMLRIWYKEGMEVLKMGPSLRELKADVVGDIRTLLSVLMGTVGILLLIACANVANLLLVRASGRQRDLAVRAALGAGRGRIARELLIESVMLGSSGGLLGLALAHSGLRLLVRLRPANLPRLNEISIDPTVLAFLIATSLVSALLFGLIPVIKQVRPEIAMALGGSGRTLSSSRERHRSQNTFVVVQVALALVLLVAAGLMIRSFAALIHVHPGFMQPEELQLARISIPEADAADPERVIRMQNQILDKLAAIPGVVSAAFALAMPMEDAQFRNAVAAEGKNRDDQVAPMRVAKFVSPGLFATQETPVVAGRDFTWTDIYEKRPVAIVAERMARETWGGVSEALGKRIRIGNVGDWREIIGVVGDVHDEGPQQQASSTVYWRAGVQPGIMGAPISAPRSMAFAIRSARAGSESFLAEIRQAVWSVNPKLPLAQVRTLADVYNRSMARTSFTLTMLAIAASMALGLGVVGIYGVMAYSVAQRRRDIGIRLALGAEPASLRRTFVQRGLLLATIGILIGFSVAVPLTRLMSSLLFSTSPLDLLTFAAVAVVLSTAAAVASYLPARRASAVDPVEVLKAE